MGVGDELSFDLFRNHSAVYKKLLHNFGPHLLYRLTIDPLNQDASVFDVK